MEEEAAERRRQKATVDENRCQGWWECDCGREILRASRSRSDMGSDNNVQKTVLENVALHLAGQLCEGNHREGGSHSVLSDEAGVEVIQQRA